MPFKKIFFLILIFSLSHFCNYGQRINYSNLFSYTSNNIFKIAGKVGNNIHIWKFNEFTGTAKEVRLAISILIFSDQMQLIKEVPIKMGDDVVSCAAEYFQMDEDVYYAYINYSEKDFPIKKQVLKIDRNGNIISSTAYITAPEKHSPYYASGKYSYAKKDSTIYYVNTTSTIREPNEQSEITKNQNDLTSRLFIYKQDLAHTNPLMQTQYASAIFNFTDQRVMLDSDNTVWVCASNKFDPEKKRKDSSTLYSLFLVRLDSNLREISSNEKFLTINAPDINKKIFYKIDHAFISNKNLYLLTIGNHLTTYYSDDNSIFQRLPGQRYLPPVRVGREGYEIKSLRIIQIDESNNCVKDTIISTDLFKAKLLTGNCFYASNADGVDLFYLQRFPHKSDGILHISIGRYGIRQNDVPVNPNYHYRLQNSTKIDEGTYIIPFSDDKFFGFVKWTNSN